MGMAASQARFLGLTARKNNVEFEGQQINQQRTALSNQSANYYNDLLGMSVPVPPSVDDYTKTVYTFEDGALTNQITSLIAQGGGKYTVSYLRQWTDDFAVVTASTSVVNGSQNGPWQVGAQKLRPLGNITAADIAADEYLSSLSTSQIDQLKKEEQEYAQLIQEELGAGTYLVRYIQNTSTGEWSPYFYRQSDLQKAGYDGNGNSLSNVNCYTIGSKTRTEELKAVQGCEIEKDSSGRLINITIPDGDGKPRTYALTTSTVTDQDKYEDAMNQYEYEKYEYDQAIQEINSKIEIIQAEDKNLELRLKQLDTEQKAISTEVDAVSQVIQKNTESSFKTFG